MEQGTRWAIRGDHLRGRDDSAMPTLERCCHANSARGAAQSPHAWHVGDGKLSRSLACGSGVAIARGRPIFFLRRNFFLFVRAIEWKHPPPSRQGGWWGVPRGLFKMGLPRPSPKVT